jgi:protein tyrosine phosphatase type 4A
MALCNAQIIKNDRTFLITPSPNEKNIKEYIELLKSKSINLVIKVTEDKLYDPSIYKDNNIDYIELSFNDGSVPNHEQVEKLIDIIKEYKSICVHCRAGLGRAPLIMTLILILEFKMDIYDTIEQIKLQIPNAFNKIQLNYLYKFKRNTYVKENNCIVM